MINPLKHNILPKPPSSFLKLLGPSFIFVGLSLGTGELILWPYLTANYGLGIIWGALLGITMQFFLNMEIERYALANGESIFVGFARIFKKIPYWFILSTIIAWSWPGFSAASAAALKPFGFTNTTLINVLMLILVGLILTLGPTLYKTVETFQKILIAIGIPLIIVVAYMLIHLTHLEDLGKGLIGIGDGYFLFPHDVNFPLMTFLAALAYSGAGGNLLLAQSFYVKEKGYGMGKYAKKITSLITGTGENVEIEGSTFQPTQLETEKFRKWWNMANLEHLIIFWGLGLGTMLLLALISYSSVYGKAGNSEGINFLYNQAEVIGQSVGPLFGAFMLIVTSLMLFATQLTVIDAAGRIITENIMLVHKGDARKIYYSSVWILLLFGIGVVLLGYGQPTTLIVLGAILNAFCMFVFSGLLIKTNQTLLPKTVQPAKWRVIIVYSIFVILGLFTLLVIASNIFGFDLVSYLR